MQKRFLINILILLGLNLLIKPFWIFAIDRNVQNIAGSAEYGLYYAVFNFTFIFNILLDVGITNFNNRNIAMNADLLKRNLYSISFIKMLLGVVYFLVILITAYFIGYSIRQFHFLYILGINQFLLSFILFLRSNISGLQLFKTDSLLSILDRIFVIIICSLLLWGNFTTEAFKIEWFIYSQFFAYLLTFLICLVVVLHKAGKIHFKIEYRYLKDIIRQSLPFALLILLMSFYNRIDSVMLERLLENGSYYTGVYASGFRILDAAIMVGYLFAIILLPLFSKMIKNKETVIPVVKTSFNLLLIYSVFITVFCVIFSSQIMQMLYPQQSSSVAFVFSILILGLTPFTLTYVFGTLLTANGNLRVLNIIAFSGMIFNIALNLIIIPKFKAEGAAVVSVLTQFTTCLIQIVFACRFFKIQVKLRSLLKYLLCCLFISISIYVVSLYIKDIKIAILLSFILSYIIASGFQIFKPIEFIKVFRASSE